jgi:Glycosyltransferase
MIMKKVCFVVQRYGMEVNGGAELQCRMIAERMTPYYNIEVLTTKAIDYVTWKDEYKNEHEIINNVKVRRFSVEKQRKQASFDSINYKFLQGGITTYAEEMKWVEEQGPTVPELVHYLNEHKEDYAAFVFFTYLYYPTVMGMPMVKEKAIVVPECHDEPFLRMGMMKEVFLKAKAYFYNTMEERNLVERKFQTAHIKNQIGGVGVEVPENISGQTFKEKYGVENYIIYVGRIDEGKNCHVMFEYFKEYKKRNASDLKLVLMGKAVMNIPKDSDIVSLGFVDEQDKFNGIAGAKLLLLPSEFESLSIVVLEAMALKRPVLVNGLCDVVKGHCLKSNGGLFYKNYFEFEGTLNYILEKTDIAKVMGENGYKYVEENYQWDIIIQKMTELIEFVDELNGDRDE